MTSLRARRCPACGQEAMMQPRQRTCSRACREKWQAEQRLALAPVGLCVACGVHAPLPFQAHGHALCSQLCRARAAKGLKRGRMPTPRKRLASYEEAQALMRGRGLRTRREYQSAIRTDPALAHLPTNAERQYQSQGWQGWAQFLGVRPRRPRWRAFAAARAYVRALGLRNAEEHARWAASDERPVDIPANPSRIYRDQAWAGMADYLGVTNCWNRPALLAFLRSLRPHIAALSPAELAVLLREARVWNEASHTLAHASALRRILSLPETANLAAECDAILEELTALRHCPDAARTSLPTATPMAAGPATEQTDDVVPSDPVRVLGALQSNLDAAGDAAGRLIEFFEAKALAKLWALILSANSAAPALERIAGYEGGEYANRLRERFVTQWNGTARIAPPAGYDFRIKGRLVQPNLMQRLLAYRLKEERRIGNWSAPGAGKTLGAILASRVVDSHLTVVVAANNTLDGWEHELRGAWPDSVVLKKERGAITLDPRAHTYLLLNYEAFQQRASAQMVDGLADAHEISMIVLDEVHNIKQRGAVETRRRSVLAGLLERAGRHNPGLYVLGMSATPVINSLDEGASLLAMILGTSQDDLETTSTVANAIRLHERLVIHGVRYRPDYRQQVHETTPVIDGTHLAPALDALPGHRVLPLEQALLVAKMEHISAVARPGTVVYTHYVAGMVDPLRARLEAAGLRVVEFTGRSKVGLELFKAGQADVLIGSATLREGVDGLQHVSNRVIVASLPWTHAAYEQLIGRFYRQGSAFSQVDVIVPQVVVGDGAWSWDRERMARVRYKKTLGDCALDGVIPEAVLESEQTMLQRSLDALHSWIARLEEAHVGGSGSTSP